MRINHLKKISLRLYFADQTEGAADCRMIFIYGLSGSGLCPLEVELHQKGIGDMLQMVIPGDRIPEFFGHLYRMLCGKLKPPGTATDVPLKIVVEAIEAPDDREIIQAMAQTVSHSCGGTCDCGCS